MIFLNRNIILLIFLLQGGTFSYSQIMINGDLEDQYAGTSVTPPGWQLVPYTDPNCLATTFQQATPDLYSTTGPDLSFGLYGIPYSGITFVTGVYGYSPLNDVFWQEGIKQTISGFTIDSSYVIGFLQAVKVRNSCYDPSGSWIVLLDDQIIEVTNPTFSIHPDFDPVLNWEKREVMFTATSSTHTIKFLPQDNDNQVINQEYGEAGAICMALDSVYLKNYTCDKNFDLGTDRLFCEGDSSVIDAFQVNASYQWSTGSTVSSICLTESGIYTVEVTAHDCPVVDSIVYFDTVEVVVIPYPVVNLGDSPQIICSYETLLLDAFAENASYNWQNWSTESSFLVSEPGIYFVEVDRMGCISQDTIKVEFEFCEGIIEMPNVFSPNGDDINDFFTPVIIEGIQRLHIVILNRWGQIVFETDNLIVEWDAKDLNGKDVTDGVYFWKVEFIDEINKVGSLTGVVSLVR